MTPQASLSGTLPPKLATIGSTIEGVLLTSMFLSTNTDCCDCEHPLKGLGTVKTGKNSTKAHMGISVLVKLKK